MDHKVRGKDRPVIILQADLMPVTLAEYARQSNQSYDAVKMQHHKGAIPTFQLGKSRTVYVNRAKMVLASLEAADWDVQLPRDFYHEIEESAQRSH